MKNKYDTSVVHLYSSGNEQLLPEEFRKQIPYSTISTWRKTNNQDYLGYEFRSFFEDVRVTASIKTENEKLKRILRGITKSWIMFSPQVEGIVKTAKKDKELQKKILECIFLLKRDMGLKSALRFFGISKGTYDLWLLEHKVHCLDSFVALCAKRHPHQLRLREIRKMKRMLTDPSFSHWPIVSIANMALRKGSIVANIDSWYKYAKILNPWREKPVKKTVKTQGIVSKCPNEYLHVDTTFYPINSSKTLVIAFVMDNYSKMVLGYQVADSISFRVVKEALAKAVDTISQQESLCESYLVTDGGTENNNKHIDEFISEVSGHKITKIRALKDIRFSNSPVEAIHRIMKGRYLRNREFVSIEGFTDFLNWAVTDYNNVRPHYRRKPFTPEEVYFKKSLDFNVHTRIRKAIKKRINRNRCSTCTACCTETNRMCSVAL